MKSFKLVLIVLILVPIIQACGKSKETDNDKLANDYIQKVIYLDDIDISNNFEITDTNITDEYLGKEKSNEKDIAQELVRAKVRDFTEYEVVSVITEGNTLKVKYKIKSSNLRSILENIKKDMIKNIRDIDINDKASIRKEGMKRLKENLINLKQVGDAKEVDIKFVKNKDNKYEISDSDAGRINNAFFGKKEI